ncbi:MAG: NADH-quinone oxidoreductase subunit G [Gammaproteobacteria bacterium]|nr:NADH-quinone oxidoreductase subunit G [Gammaproteobacteria bacterium]
MAEIEIEIDGKKLTAEPNQTVIQVADAAGIYIPRFCYHHLLSIPANCRMCLVEIEKAPKALPACATPVMPGMKVFTKSAKTIAAQRAVMEFLLINHPLDCPICDQGGECELQDLSMGYGASWSHYDEKKRAVADQNIGPLVETEMTRCIYCTRCVRFGDEIAGLRELGVIGRGEFSEISTYIKHAIHSEVSGNIIDLCPVGALTSKPFRYTARPWELDQAPGISPHDCTGSNINIHTRYGSVMRVVSRDNMQINEIWAADRDRFSYTGLYHADRLQEPMAKINGIWQAVDWEQALYLAAKSIRQMALQSESIGALASPSSTVEEFYLLQKLTRALGSNNIDHRLREIDTADQISLARFPGLTLSFDELESCDAILLIGSNIQKEQPIVGLRVRKASLKGASIFAINPVDYAFNFALTGKQIVAPQDTIDVLVQLINDLQSGATQANEKSIAQNLKSKKKICILLGALSLHHPEAATIRAHAQQLAELTGATLGTMTTGSNSAGGWLAGAIPHRTPKQKLDQPGLSAYQMLEKALPCYILMNVEPSLDCANSTLANQALMQAQCVVALSIYQNPRLQQYASVILPMTPFTETGGTYVNVTGVWQNFKGVAKPLGEARPAWKILRALANFLELDEFQYESVEEVRHEVLNHVEHATFLPSKLPTKMQGQAKNKATLMRIGEIPLYAIDSIVRRAEPLQEAQQIMLGDLACIRLHPETAQALECNMYDQVQVRQDNETVTLPLVIDDRIARNAALVYGGIPETSALGNLFGEIEVFKS